MATVDPWPVIHRERGALATDLAEVPADAWTTPSLCHGWTVHDMLGHIVSTAKMSKFGFFGKLAGAGFQFNRMTAKNVAEETASGPAHTLDELRAHAADSTSPPGPTETWLGEIIVHSTDIRWPLAMEHDFPIDALIRVADFYKGSNTLIGSKNRIAGLTLKATDIEWSTGSGPEVSGPLLALVMAMTGRAAALDRLDGPGLDMFKTRFKD
ncbi:MAG TPA: maleylpyruvate isomerase family mycothiol-dependent enzyme [Amycolatopsis sp.]|nr:maleylpyruvate isomerase family mycothiol-dependent enzyme [Amycolatopsis sp.]